MAFHKSSGRPMSFLGTGLSPSAYLCSLHSYSMALSHSHNIPEELPRFGHQIKSTLSESCYSSQRAPSLQACLLSKELVPELSLRNWRPPEAQD